jgi:hypothetical protein
MKLQDGVFQVRQALTEFRSRFFSDTEIVIALNTSARRMCSKAQNLQSYFTFTTQIIEGDNTPGAGSWQQEYALPIDVDCIIGAAYFSGCVFPITPVGREVVQMGGRVGGIPWYFYIKEMTRTLTPQVDGGSIVSIPIQNELGEEYRTVMGLYPVPQSGIPVYLWYIEQHRQMKNPFDSVGIPERFALPWYAYAIARMKEKEGAIADAQYWQQIHDLGTDEMVQWSADNMTLIVPPFYSTRPLPPTFLRGSTSVIVVSQNPTMSGNV